MRESEFEQYDREHFEALLDLKADTCPGCRGLLSETTRDDGHGYDVAHDATCHRCAALARAQHDFAEWADKAPKENGFPLGKDRRPVVPSAQLWTTEYLPPPD